MLLLRHYYYYYFFIPCQPPIRNPNPPLTPPTNTLIKITLNVIDYKNSDFTLIL